MAERGRIVDESLILRGSCVSSEAFMQIDKLLQNGVKIDAVVAANDAMASGAQMSLERHGLTIPHDVVVSGFDDSEHALKALVPLTSVRACAAQQMRRAATVLLEQISLEHRNSASEYQHVRLPAELIIRASSHPGPPHHVAPISNDGLVRQPPAHACANAVFMDTDTCHEIAERAYIALASCTERQCVVAAFNKLMSSILMSRAFLVAFEPTRDSEEQTARVVCAYPPAGAEVMGQDAGAASFPAAHLLPEPYATELSHGLLVASVMVVDDELIGALLFDPSSSGRFAMEGIAQGIFSALRHCDQREYLETQAQELKAVNAELGRAANNDPLTGLLNRKRLYSELGLAIQEANTEVVIIYIDLDGFKLINDTLGHDAGDKLLAIVASRIKACVREHDIVSRLGGMSLRYSSSA